MKPLAILLLASATLISGCRNNSGIRGYWSSRTLDIDNYPAAEEEFADFAELAAAAPESDAFAAIDQLLKKARKDDVTYIIYADLILRGFSSIASPCHSCPIFMHAADNILSHGIPSGDMAVRYKKRMTLCSHNNVGDIAEIPELVGDASVEIGQRTLVLIVDQDCSTCRQSMDRFDTGKWEGTEKVALCYGYGPLPEREGWTCYRMSRSQTLLDTREAPMFFVISPKGTVEISYTSVYDINRL